MKVNQPYQTLILSWERWDDIKAGGTFENRNMSFFDHFSYRAVIDWLYKIVAGINSTPAIPGYTRITTNLHPEKLKELKPFMNIKK